MIISDTKKFIFIHIPKTGGMSVRSSLEKYGRTMQNKNLSKHVKAKIAKMHTNWNAYFKFAFVRNPWSWLVSGYHYAKKDKRDWRHRQANSMGFKDYLRWSLESPDVRHSTLRLGQFDFIAENNNLIVDYVGKLETITVDFNHICKKLGIRSHLNHLNKTKHKDYRQYYDTSTRELVAASFKKDIQQFNYEF
jgi:hypothetical protein